MSDIKEIVFPPAKTYWIAVGDGIVISGETDTNQVTITGLKYISGANSKEELSMIAANFADIISKNVPEPISEISLFVDLDGCVVVVDRDGKQFKNGKRISDIDLNTNKDSNGV